MNKKIFLFFLIFVIIGIIISSLFAYKLSNSGNTINKSENNILNIKSYEAILEVEIYNNKNTSKYLIKQEYYKPNIIKQEILEPENIKGLSITFNGENLIIENKLLNLKTFYENYNYIGGNSFSLISFIEQYKNAEYIKLSETDVEDIVEIKINLNKYQMYKKLYTSKDTNLPTKMEILDMNKNRTVYILYREIEINKTSKEKILAN